MICFVFKPARMKDGKRHESPYYSGKLRLDTWPRPRVFALHTTDKRIAEAKLHEIAKEHEKEAMGLLPSRSVRQTLGKPLNDLLDEFLADLKAIGRTPGTLRKYGGTLRILFERLGWVELRSVNAASFTRWRVKSTLSAKSMNDMLANCGTFFHWLEHQRLLHENPLRYVQRIDTRGAKQRRRFMTEEEETRFLESAPLKRARVYLTALKTGLRRKEMNAICWGDFKLDEAAPYIRVPASIAKNRKETVLPLHEAVASALRELRPPDWAPFQCVFKGQVPRIETFRRDLAAANIPLVDESGRHLDFHSLRGTFGTRLLVSGVHPRVAQELMRHSDIRLTTKLYTDASQLPLAAGLAQLPSFTLRKSEGTVTPRNSGTPFTLRKSNTQKHTQKDAQTGVSGVPAVSLAVTKSRNGESLQSA
jgi:integrase